MELKDNKLFFEHHELASSLRTEGVRQIIFDGNGEIVDEFHSQKKSLIVELPDNAQYLLRRYWTNSSYPEHELFSIPSLKKIAGFHRETTPSEIEGLSIPDGIKNFLHEDLFG